MEAYNALFRAKGKNESLTEAILRLTGKSAKGNLLEYIRSKGPNNQLADSIEKVLERRSSIHLRTARVNAVRKKQTINAARSMDRPTILEDAGLERSSRDQKTAEF